MYFHCLQEVESTKKRKIAEKTPSKPITSIDPDSVILWLPKLTFQSPLRKKLNLVFAVDKITGKPALAICQDDLKPELILTELTNKGVYFSHFLPSAGKSNQEYLILFYRHAGKNAKDPMLLNFNQEALVKDLTHRGVLKDGDTDYKRLIIRQAKICGFDIKDGFRTGGNCFYVEAHKGSKEGTLYFLLDHILFGFKKPIILYDLKDVKSITYSSITRITFNITLLIRKDEQEQKIEFSMIDQSEFSKIDLFVKSKEVVDNSMAEELKAKPLNKKVSDAIEGAVEEALTKAENIEEEDSDDEEEDGTYQIGAEEDESSDESSAGEAEDDDDEDDEDEEEEEEE